MPASPKLISLGRIVKTQGLRGAFRVYPHGQDSENLASLEEIVIQPLKAEAITARITSCRRKGMLFILTIEGVESIDHAERLIGAEVLAPESDLAPLEEGEFYWYELVGMEVVTDQGERLGEVKSIIPTGANDVLQVMSRERETLLPNIPDVVKQIDREKKLITVHLFSNTE
jgi:16S rRNA processing protein RimM